MNYPKDQFEVILVDSGADRETQKVIDQYDHPLRNLKVLRPGLGNIGPARARNIGLRGAEFEFIAFTDDDCLVPPDWLNLLAEGFTAEPRAAAVGGILSPSAEKLKNNIFARYEDWTYRRARRENKPYHSSVRDELPAYANNISYRTEIIRKLGGFSEDFLPFIYGEDGDLKERALNLGYIFYYVPVTVTHLDDYSFKGFWAKAEKRGAGILKFRKDHSQRRPSKPEIALRIFISPLIFVFSLKSGSFDFGLALAKFLAYLGRQSGQIKYYDRV